MCINQLDKPAVSMQTDISQVKTPRLFIPDHSSPAGCVRGVTFKVHLNLPHLLASNRARIDREDGSISLKARQVRGQTSGCCQKLTINKKERMWAHLCFKAVKVAWVEKLKQALKECTNCTSCSRAEKQRRFLMTREIKELFVSFQALENICFCNPGRFQ